MRSFSATNDPDREIGPFARRTVRRRASYPTRGRPFCRVDVGTCRTGRPFCRFFLKNRTRLAVPLVVSGRLFGRTKIRRRTVRHDRFGQLPPGSLPFGAYAAGARACGSVSRRSGRRNRSLRRHRRRVRTTRWPAEPLGRVLSSFPFCDRNGVKIRFTNIR